MAKNAPKTTANTENNVYNQHKTTTCRITDEDEKNENTEPEKLPMYSRLRNFTTSLSKMKTRYSLLLHQVILTSY